MIPGTNRRDIRKSRRVSKAETLRYPLKMAGYDTMEYALFRPVRTIDCFDSLTGIA